MAKRTSQPGISAQLVELLHRVRPIDEETGKPISENKWCIQAGVNGGYFRDLRNGVEPGLDKIERLARRAGVTLTELLEGAERPIDPLPSAEELSGFVAAAQGELQPGATLADYPQVVGPAVLSRLRRFVADRRFALSDDASSAPDKGARSHSATKPSAPAE